jgi:probable F420-dependent oxidoreductase
VKFNIECPVDSHADAGAWLRSENLVRFAQGAEAAGFDGLSVTDHPAPSRKWLENGGHESFDPFAALTFFAGVTKTIRLMTRLVVVPYRNPLLQARSMMTVDVLSGGRTTFVMGAGYLRSEFSALGVNFEERGALFDEAIEAIKGIWSQEAFSFEGRHFKAIGACMSPTVVQQPHPPFWLGGNSNAVMNRIARWGQGWSVLFGPEQLAQSSRTKTIGTIADLKEALKDLEGRLAEHGRALSDIAIDVFSDACDLRNDLSAEQRVDRLTELAQLGVTWTGVHLRETSVDGAIEEMHRFGEAVIAKMR